MTIWGGETVAGWWRSAAPGPGSNSEMIIQAGRAAGAGPRPRQYIEMHGATIMGSWARPLLPLLTSDNTLHGDIHQPGTLSSPRCSNQTKVDQWQKQTKVSLESFQNSNSLHDFDIIHNIGLNSSSNHIVLVWPQFNTFIILFETYREVQKILWRPVVVIVDCVVSALVAGQNTLWRLSWHYIITRPGGAPAPN